MPHAFSSEWLSQFSDPYAVLGISVAADDRRVLKRYHAIAKLLHPDSLAASSVTEREFASHLLARLINPAYQGLKQEKTRTERAALLRLRARQLHRETKALPNSVVAQELLKVSVQELDVFYEQTIAKLSQSQFQPLSQFAIVTPQLAELNLLYLHLKAGIQVREKSTGIIAAQPVKSIQFVPSPVETTEMAVSYAQRHYQRAQEHARKGAWAQAVVELRDAIRLESDRSEYHSLLAKAYLMQNLTGMAKVHFRQALKFNPNDVLALQYAAKLDLMPASPSVATPPKPAQTATIQSSTAKAARNHGIFNLFARKR